MKLSLRLFLAWRVLRGEIITVNVDERVVRLDFANRADLRRRLHEGMYR